MKSAILSISIAALLAAGCAKQPDMVVKASEQQKTTAVANRQPQTPATLTGKVLDVLNAGGYTYLQIATPSGTIWAAVREAKIAKGATVTIAPQMVAENFQSNTLHRKFDRLVMGELATSPGPQEASVLGMAGAGTVKVDKVEGSITVAEVWTKKGQLKDSPVVIRGKVVKFLPEIMGKNWLHLRDGSGARADGTDDITVTTTGAAKVGDVITVRGTLHLDKDFGAGYVYPVIVEDAKVENSRE